MSKRAIRGVMAIAVAFAGAGVALADDASTRKDLTSVIALQGLPCGQVTDVKTLGDNDYIASCQDGNRYHVFVNPQGRVVAQKQ
ncbi:MAG TPA: hypothetical protein VIH15_08220 [Casimicrobiaceae bacterium]